MRSWRYLLPRQARFLRCRQMTINIATIKSHSRPSHYLLRSSPPPVAGLLLSTMKVPPALGDRFAVGRSFSRKTFNLARNDLDWEVTGLEGRSGFNIMRSPRQEEGESWRMLIRTKDISPCHPSCGLMCIVAMPTSRMDLFAIKLGFDRDFPPICIISETSHPALRSRSTSLSALFDFPDSLDSNNLSGKTFWQCKGLEKFGWRNPSLQVLLPRKHMQCGLWALRADRSGTSNFMLRTSGFRSNCLVNICFQKLEAFGNTYSLALRQFSESSQDMQRLTS